MSNESTVIDTLRSVRHADDEMARLQEGTLEALRPRLEAALADPNWEHGPAELRGIYGTIRKVLATSKNGDAVQISVKEDGDKLVLGKVRTFATKLPTMDIAQEMIETAKAAALALLEDDFDAAAPMLKTMSRSLDVSGDLQRRINLEMDVQGLKANRWYHEVVAENFKGEIKIPSLVQEGEITTENVSEALDSLGALFASELAEAVSAMKRAVSLNSKVVEDAAQAISEDMKHAIRAVKGASRSDQNEMVRVYESVMSVAPRLVAGARFLVKLVDDELSEDEE